MTLAPLLPFAEMVAALLLDRTLGEPPNQWHPLAAFGRVAKRVEAFRAKQTASVPEAPKGDA